MIFVKTILIINYKPNLNVVESTLIKREVNYLIKYGDGV